MTDFDTAHRAFERDLGAATTSQDALAALHALSDALTGARLFTVMTVDMQAGLARRAYTSDPVNYPGSGTKPISRDSWFEGVHTRHEMFVANTLDDIAKVFPDYELIGQLGCGSVVNMPVLRAGGLVATVNILDAEGFWTDARLDLVQREMTLANMAALAVHDLL